MPTLHDLDVYYKTIWTTVDDAATVYQIQADERVHYLKRHLNLPANAKILDVGSGHGLLYDAFLKNGFPKASFYATDPSPENLERLKKRGIQGFSDIKDIGNQQFDLVTICYVLEHVPNPVSFLTSIISYVKQGGYVFIDLPERDDTFKSFLEPHVVVFSEKSLLALAKKINLSVIHHTGYGPQRKLLITEQNRNRLFKYLDDLKYKFELRLYSTFFPLKTDDIQKNRLFETFHFDEEGFDRWWIRSVMKKE